MLACVPRRPVFVVALVALVFSGAPVDAQDDVDDLRDQREEKRREAADVALEIDALSAEDQELVAALEALDAHIVLQESKVATAEASIVAAEAESVAARGRAEELAVGMEFIRDRLRERAVQAFVAPRLDAVEQLNSDDLLETALRTAFLEVAVDEEYGRIDQLRTAEAEMQSEERIAADAAARAESVRVELQARLEELAASRIEAEEIRTQVQSRIVAWEDVGHEIEAADAAIAAEIRQIEADIARAAAEEAIRVAAAEEAARRAAEEAAAEDDNNSDAVVEPVSVGDFVVTHRPVPGVITSVFGPRVHPIFGTTRNHYGIDMNGDRGDPIFAAASGVVISARSMNGYGNTVVVSHGGGITTLYAHQDSLLVSEGDQVAGGEVIGQVGSSGWSTGPHLHWEVRVEGIAVDPEPYL